MRRALCALSLTAGVFVAGTARAEQVCMAAAPDPAITVALRFSDDGKATSGEVHWAVPGEKPDQPSMVHIVYPLDGDHAASRPNSVITLNAVTGKEITHSPTASVQIVIDGMDMAVRAWDSMARRVEQLEEKSHARRPAEGQLRGRGDLHPELPGRPAGRRFRPGPEPDRQGRQHLAGAPAGPGRRGHAGAHLPPVRHDDAGGQGRAGGPDGPAQGPRPQVLPDLLAQPELGPDPLEAGRQGQAEVLAQYLAQFAKGAQGALDRRLARLAHREARVG
ncbi:MAG: hypothetical protein WDN45_00845 [Caulobacteraceae bacterium]